MKGNQLVRYSKDTELQVHYPDFIWLWIASFCFGFVCWYLGYIGALMTWFENMPLVVSYLFYVLVSAAAFFSISAVIKVLDRKMNWLTVPEKRFSMQFFCCFILPAVFLFAVTQPIALPKNEWLWLPLSVIFGAVLMLNLVYTLYFYCIVFVVERRHRFWLQQQVCELEEKIMDLRSQLPPYAQGEHTAAEMPPSGELSAESDPAEEIDIASVRALDPQQEAFLLNNRLLTKKIMYDELGMFEYENTSNTPLVKLYLRKDMTEDFACEQRSLNEVVRDTGGYVQKIDRHHAIPLHMIQTCQQLKGGKLRIALNVPFDGQREFQVSSRISRRIKEWVMLQVPIEKDNYMNQ